MQNKGASEELSEEKKVETVLMLCERCSGRVCETYYLEPRKGEGRCVLCGREEARAYAMEPRKRPMRNSECGMRNDKRARWREPWREK